MHAQLLPPHVVEAVAGIFCPLVKSWEKKGYCLADAEDLAMLGICKALEKGAASYGDGFNRKLAFTIARNAGKTAAKYRARMKKREESARRDPRLRLSSEDDPQFLATMGELFDELQPEMQNGRRLTAVLDRAILGLPKGQRTNLARCLDRRKARLQTDDESHCVVYSSIADPFDKDIAGLAGSGMDQSTIVESVSGGYANVLAELILRVAENRDAQLDESFYSSVVAALPLYNWHVYWVLHRKLMQDLHHRPARWRNRVRGLLRLTQLGVKKLRPMLRSGCPGFVKILPQFLAVSTNAARWEPQDCTDAYRDLPAVKDDPILAHALAVPGGFLGDDGSLVTHYSTSADPEMILVGHALFTDEPIRGRSVNFDMMQHPAMLRGAAKSMAGRPAHYLTWLLDYTDKSLRDDCCMGHEGTVRMTLCAAGVYLGYFRDKTLLSKKQREVLGRIVQSLDTPNFIPARMSDLRESILGTAKDWQTTTN